MTTHCTGSLHRPGEQSLYITNYQVRKLDARRDSEGDASIGDAVGLATLLGGATRLVYAQRDCAVYTLNDVEMEEVNESANTLLHSFFPEAKWGLKGPVFILYMEKY